MTHHSKYLTNQTTISIETTFVNVSKFIGYILPTNNVCGFFKCSPKMIMHFLVSIGCSSQSDSNKLYESRSLAIRISLPKCEIVNSSAIKYTNANRYIRRSSKLSPISFKETNYSQMVFDQLLCHLFLQMPSYILKNRCTPH